MVKAGKDGKIINIASRRVSASPVKGSILGLQGSSISLTQAAGLGLIKDRINMNAI